VAEQTADDKRASNAGKSDDATEQAVQQVRDVAKWLIASFAAIGAAMIAGSQLSNIGHLPSGDRLTSAIVAAAIALVGTLAAILAATHVLLPSPMNLRTVERKRYLRNYFNSNRDLLPIGVTTVEQLRTTWDERQSEYHSAEEELAQAGGTPSAEVLQQFRTASARKDSWKTAVNEVRGIAGVQRLRRRFHWALAGMVVGVAAAGAGIVCFAWASNPPKPKAAAKPAVAKRSAVLEPAPTLVDVDLTRSGARALRPSLGDNCRSPVRAIAIGGKPAQLEVVVLPRHRCSAIRFTLTPHYGKPVAVKPQRVQ
jgi:hypothetical protein